MGTIIASGICCCFSCCCQECSDALLKLLGEERVTKIYYIFLVVIFVVPSILVFFFLNQWQGFLDFFSSWLTCPASSGGGYECIGSSAVYRISLSILALFVIMLIVTFCRNRLSMVVNEGLFCVKYIFVIGLFIGLLFVPNSVFSNYSEASKYISIIFMVLQSIILIDLFYMAGIRLVKRYDDGEASCGVTLIVLSVIFEGIAFFMNIYGYIVFNQSNLCGSTVWVNVITTIILVILPLLQLFNFNKQNSLLTTSMVSAYVSYLAFICQYSYANGSCSRMTTDSLIGDICVSTFMFILTMYGSIMGGSGQVKVTQNGDINKAMGVAPTEPQDHEKYQAKNVEKEEKQLQNQQKYTNSWIWPKWHFYMCLASIYIGMLITNWTSASIITGNLGSNDFGFWVRIIISWATTLLYIWTLLAPKVFPERDFTVV